MDQSGLDKTIRAEMELGEQLNQVFYEISTFFGAILKRGLVSISTSDIEQYIEFKSRLNEFGVKKFIIIFETFIQNAEKMMASKSKIAILDLIDSIMKILIYMRTYERVSSQFNVLDQIQSLLPQPISEELK
ncbi:MAG: hypothetical protein ACTSRK_09170 [Promethearchaeota archaeon]